MKNPSQVSDYYERLGLEKNASKEEIRHAYRKLTKKYHPDMNLGNEKASKLEFDVIRQAYEVLISRKGSSEGLSSEIEKHIYQKIYDFVNDQESDDLIKSNRSPSEYEDYLETTKSINDILRSHETFKHI